MQTKESELRKDVLLCVTAKRYESQHVAIFAGREAETVIGIEISRNVAEHVPVPLSVGIGNT